MKALGLTGGVGMGKSTAAGLFSQAGVPVVDSDLLARQIVQPGQPALAEIQDAFGRDIVGPDGQLQRPALAQIVFADAAARRRLEEITHPRIRALWQSQLERWRKEGRVVALAVVPLLFEVQAAGDFDATIAVACAAGTQRQRLLMRGWDAIQIQQRIEAQWPIERKVAEADFVVWAEGSRELLEPQVRRILAVV